MSRFLERTILEAKSNKQTIVLAEGDDVRTLEAAAKILQQDIANLIILGDKDAIVASGYALEGAEIVDPRTAEEADGFAQTLFELRQKKGMTLEMAQQLVLDPLYFGVLMVHSGLADGMVAGACHATADVLRPSLQILRTAPGTKLVSSFFVMDVPNCDFGQNGVFVFADCGLVPDPSADDLSEIALASAKSFEALVGGEARVAMLCFSTYGSAKGPLVEKVQEATALAKQKAPDLALDGELQLDAAIVPSVAASKAPGSPVAGAANVLVFPDLNAGNIGYKLVQRLAKADAFGPITQGIAKPVNDLSRGCCADDIVGVVAITCVQSQCRKAAL